MAVGHIPKQFSRVVSFVVKKAGSAEFCEVTGSSINRGVGLGVDTCRQRWTSLGRSQNICQYAIFILAPAERSLVNTVNGH